MGHQRFCRIVVGFLGLVAAAGACSYEPPPGDNQPTPTADTGSYTDTGSTTDTERAVDSGNATDTDPEEAGVDTSSSSPCSGNPSCECDYEGKSSGVCVNSTYDPEAGQCQKPEKYEPTERTCDNRDNDCDGKIDENLTEPCGTSKGVCEKGMWTCSGGEWGECKGATEGSSEVCDGKDNDCDGKVDNGDYFGALCDGLCKACVRGECREADLCK